MLALDNVHFRYDERLLLRYPDIRAGQGEHLLISGPSGSGKTTLIHLAAGLLKPTTGEIYLAGENILKFSGGQLDQFRGRFIGIVFQRLFLMERLSILDNLLMARYMAGLPQNRDRAEELLEMLGLDSDVHQMPHELSQGQAQRVAVARAVINEPSVILADEPTAALDDENCERTIDLLINQAKACGATLLIASHDTRLKKRFGYGCELEVPRGLERS